MRYRLSISRRNCRQRRALPQNIDREYPVGLAAIVIAVGAILLPERQYEELAWQFLSKLRLRSWAII